MPNVRRATEMEDIHPSRYREAALHGTPQFPMRVYLNNFNWYAGGIIDLHWHPEIELAVVLSGRVSCLINDIPVDVGEGEGFFINSNTMHTEHPASTDIEPTMITVCFMPEFIGDCGSDLIYRKYVAPVVNAHGLYGMKLSPQVDWQKEVLGNVRELYNISQNRTWGYELKCRNLIGSMWQRLVCNLSFEDTAETSQTSDLAEKRLKKMLSFIHGNYRSDLTVDQIARSANISRSECFRCFRNIIGKKPITYLNEYRLKAAAEMLTTTDMLITEICFACGFTHSSYFGKLFSRYYGVTPKQFRRNDTVGGRRETAQSSFSSPMK